MLQKLTLNCKLREFLDEALRYRFVCGINNSSIRRQLLTERTLALKIAIDLAKIFEIAEVETKFVNMEIKAEMYLLLNKNQRCY